MFNNNRKIILGYNFRMLESKSSLCRIYRLIASHTWITESEVKLLLVIMHASGIKSLDLEDKDLNKFMERSLGKMCNDSKENLQEYILKIKDKFPNNELLLQD